MVLGALVYRLSVWCGAVGYVSGLRVAAAAASLPYRKHTHHRFKITLPNTDQTHDKISVNHYK